MSDRLAIVDGRVLEESRIAIPIDNPSFLSGYGAFETVLVRHGRLVLWAEHLARLKAAAAVLGIDWPATVDTLADRIAPLVERNLGGDDEGAMRLTLTPARLVATGPEGSFWLVTVRPIPERARRKRRGVRGATLARRVVRPIPKLKTTSYVTPHLPLPERCNEWILVDRRGRVLEGGSSNLFLEPGDGTLVTPPVSAGLLPGIVREWVKTTARRLGIAVVERTFASAEAVKAEGAWATASVTGIAPWVELDGHRLAGFGPIGRRIRKEYQKRVEGAG